MKQRKIYKRPAHYKEDGGINITTPDYANQFAINAQNATDRVNLTSALNGVGNNYIAPNYSIQTNGLSYYPDNANSQTSASQNADVKVQKTTDSAIKDDGNAMTKALGVVPMVGTMVNTGMNLANITDSSGQEAYYNALANTQFTTGNTNQLASELSNPIIVDRKSMRDIRGYDEWGEAGQIMQETGSGASIGGMIGSIGGPVGTGIGTAIGAAVGNIVGIGSALLGRNEAKREKKRLDKLAATTEARIGANSQNAVEATNAMNFLNASRNVYAEGGPIQYGSNFNNGVTIINTGGRHEENSYGGVQQGIAPDGLPNLVEEGEVIYKDFVLSNRLKMPKQFKSKYRFGGTTYAEAAKIAQKESENRPNDPISKRGLDRNMKLLAQKQAEEKVKNEPINAPAVQMPIDISFANGGPLKRPAHYKWGGDPIDRMNFGTDYANQFAINAKNSIARTNLTAALHGVGNNYRAPNYSMPTPRLSYYPDIPQNTNLYENNLNALKYNLSIPAPYAEWSNAMPVKKEEKSIKQDASVKEEKDPPLVEGIYRNPAENLMYAPIVGSTGQVMLDALGVTNNPDYTNARNIEAMADKIPYISANPIGDYMGYNPVDRQNIINNINANAAANRTALKNQSNGNRATAAQHLLQSDYNTLKSLGDFGINAEAENQNRRQAMLKHNTAINQYNSENALRAATANREIDKFKAQQYVQAASLRQRLNDEAEAARALNINNLFTNSGNLGKQIYSQNNIDSLLANGVLQQSAADIVGSTHSKKWKEAELKKRGFTKEEIDNILN